MIKQQIISHTNDLQSILFTYPLHGMKPSPVTVCVLSVCCFSGVKVITFSSLNSTTCTKLG